METGKEANSDEFSVKNLSLDCLKIKDNTDGDGNIGMTRQLSCCSVPTSPNEYRNNLGLDICTGGPDVEEYTETLEIEERISEVYIKTTENEECHTGFELHTTSKGHRIKITDPENHILQQLALKDGDILMAFNSIDIRYYDHDLVLGHIKHLLHHEEGEISLIISRKSCEIDFASAEEIEEDTLLEIELSFEYSNRGPGSILRITSRILKATFKSFKPIRNVQYHGKEIYFIRSFNGTGLYLKTTSDGKLTMDTLPDIDDKHYQFVIYNFSGNRIRRNGHISDVYLCMIQSNVPDKQPYLNSTGFTNVALTAAAAPNHDVNRITKADSRFFKITKTTKGYFYLESLEQEGSYLCWYKNRIMRRVYSPADMAFADTYTEIQFALFSYEELASRR